MISQDHVDEMQQIEQAPSPVEKNQQPAPVKELHTSASTAWARSRSLLLRIFGVLVPLLGGYGIFAFPPESMQQIINPIDAWLLTSGVLALCGAILLRSWWALLVVPFALAIGMILAAIIPNIVQGGFDLQGWAASGFEPLDMVLILGLTPAVIGAAVGAPIGKGLERLQP
jgi:hypothetical protein